MTVYFRRFLFIIAARDYLFASLRTLRSRPAGVVGDAGFDLGFSGSSDEQASSGGSVLSDPIQDSTVDSS